MRIIIIAGAAHSGSTMVGCILGAAPDPYRDFYVGEISAFFQRRRLPFLPQHRTYGTFIDWYVRAKPSNAGSTLPLPNAEEHRFLERFVPADSVWRRIDHRVGSEHAYEEIERVTGTTTIVDSSKGLRWIETQSRVCSRRGWKLDIVLCIKSFASIAHSLEKRGKSPRQIARSLNYYERFERRYGAMRRCVVDIDRLVREPAAITEGLCATLDVPYFAGKERYWEFRLDYRFGASLQRRQLWGGEDPGFRVVPPAQDPAAAAGFITPSLRDLERRLKAAAVGTAMRPVPDAP